MNIFSIIRRKRASPTTDTNANKIRLSGTTINTESNTDLKPQMQPQDNPIRFEGNNWLVPDAPRGYHILQVSNGLRRQAEANTHLSEGPAPGKIPHPFKNLYHGKSGSGIDGNPNGVIANVPQFGLEDRAFIPHTPIPRAGMMVRGFRKTYNDSAYVPAIYVADATRR